MNANIFIICELTILLHEQMKDKYNWRQTNGRIWMCFYTSPVNGANPSWRLIICILHCLNAKCKIQKWRRIFDNTWLKSLFLKKILRNLQRELRGINVCIRQDNCRCLKYEISFHVIQIQMTLIRAVKRWKKKSNQIHSKTTHILNVDLATCLVLSKEYF